MMGGYFWAGPNWRSKAVSSSDRLLLGATMQSPHPGALARRWSEILGRNVVQDASESWSIALDHGVARFVPIADDRGEGLSCVHLGCRNPEDVFRAARASRLSCDQAGFELAGVRFLPVALRGG
jgi:hypothetical protein